MDKRGNDGHLSAVMQHGANLGAVKVGPAAVPTR